MVIVCKRRGYSYELKEVIELLSHKVTDDPMNNKDVKKVSPGPGGTVGLRAHRPGARVMPSEGVSWRGLSSGAGLLCQSSSRRCDSC